MPFGSLGANLHSPGPIGDVTPSTFAGTTLSLTSAAGAQATWKYDTINYGNVTVGDAGQVAFNATGTVPSFAFNIAGSTIGEITNIGIISNGANGGYGFNGKSNTANVARFCVQSVPAFGGTSGIGDGGAANTVTMVANDTDVIIVTSTLAMIKSGVPLRLGNAATTGLSAGALAATTNASIVLQDSTGQAYRIPCII